MAFDVAGARKAGYSESEILEHLATDTKFDLVGARKAGYNDAELLEHMAGAAGKPAPTLAENAVAVVKEGARQVGLTARYAVEGGMAGAGMATDPVVHAIGGAVRMATGSDYNPVTMASLGVDAANGLGLPDPATPQERVVGAMTRGGFSMAAPGAVAQNLAGNSTGTTQAVAQKLADNQGLASISGAGAGLGQQGVAEAGGGQLAQIGGALVGGIGAPVSASLIAPRAAAVANSAMDAASAGVQRIRTAVPAIAERVERTLRRNPDQVTPTPGTQASGGSAGTDLADMRTMSAEGLPVPIQLTRGQATRDPMQLRFEVETAKGEQGALLRERAAETNARFQQNFDAMVDKTGAEVIELIDVGRAVDKVIIKESARDKAQIRVAYQKADKEGETAAPVTLEALVAHLNESAPDAATAPLLTTARGRALQLGIATEDAAGNLTALPTTIKNAERMRQAIGRATDYEATNIRQSAIIKGLIDSSTESLGGTLYRSARRLRENYANKYENRAVVSSLLNRKHGSADRQVALEDVFNETVLKGSREDLGHVRRVLQTGGEEGQQAWRDLQGATATWIKEETLKNVATDQRGNKIVSAAQMDRAIKQLERGGKLDFVFGKQGAQMMRDLNDLAKVTMTTPPGSVNHSNTASVLLAALTEAGVTGSMTGLPVPVMSALRLVAVHVKSRKIQKRVEQALAGRADSAARPPRPTPPPDRTLH